VGRQAAGSVASDVTVRSVDRVWLKQSAEERAAPSTIPELLPGVCTWLIRSTWL